MLSTKKQAATCLIFSGDGKVLAVSRKHNPNDFGLPGGKVDPGETLEQAAARELQEETGLVATSLKSVFNTCSAGDNDFWTTTFLTTVEGEIDTDEAGVVRWVTPEVLCNGCFGAYNRALFAHLDDETLLKNFIELSLKRNHTDQSF